MTHKGYSKRDRAIDRVRRIRSETLRLLGSEENRQRYEENFYAPLNDLCGEDPARFGDAAQKFLTCLRRGVDPSKMLGHFESHPSKKTMRRECDSLDDLMGTRDDGNRGTRGWTDELRENSRRDYGHPIY